MECTLTQGNVKITLKNCLVDTGSSITLTNKKNIKDIKTEKNTRIRITNCAQQEITTSSEIAILDLSFQALNIKNVPIGIIEDTTMLQYDLIIGIDCLTGRTLTIGSNHNITINNFNIRKSYGNHISDLSHKYCNFDCIMECQEKSCNHKMYKFEHSLHVFNKYGFFINKSETKRIPTVLNGKFESKINLFIQLQWKLENLLMITEIEWEKNDITSITLQNIRDEPIYIEPELTILCLFEKKWLQTAEINHVRAVADLDPEEKTFHEEEFS